MWNLSNGLWFGGAAKASLSRKGVVAVGSGSEARRSSYILSKCRHEVMPSVSLFCKRKTGLHISTFHCCYFKGAVLLRKSETGQNIIFLISA